MIRFRLLKDAEECRYFHELERRVWRNPDSDMVPIHVLVTVAKNGGGLLGAFADDGPPEMGGMVGAALWWLGTDGTEANKLKVCSHIAGVLPEWQGHGIGRRLKFEQRRLVLEQGLAERITWTFDPLFVANGVLNLHRLGAVCNTYFRNVYGELGDAINKGTPSDRCQVDWHLRSTRVERAAQGKVASDAALSGAKDAEEGLTILETEATSSGFRKPIEQELSLGGAPLAVPLPDDIAAMRKQDGELARVWRFFVRRTFEEAFSAGYWITDCLRLADRGWYYILRKGLQDL